MEVQDNLSKAKDLVGCPQDVSINDWDGEEYNKLGFEYAMEMAKWKDAYFKRCLKKKLSDFEEIYRESHSDYTAGACDGIRSLLITLFNEK